MKRDCCVAVQEQVDRLVLEHTAQGDDADAQADEKALLLDI